MEVVSVSPYWSSFYRVDSPWTILVCPSTASLKRCSSYADHTVVQWPRYHISYGRSVRAQQLFNQQQSRPISPLLHLLPIRFAELEVLQVQYGLSCKHCRLRSSVPFRHETHALILTYWYTLLTICSMIYRWYKILSPHIDVFVDSVGM